MIFRFEFSIFKINHHRIIIVINHHRRCHHFRNEAPVRVGALPSVHRSPSGFACSSPGLPRPCQPFVITMMFDHDDDDNYDNDYDDVNYNDDADNVNYDYEGLSNKE